jgi:hypothetical protein
LHSESGHIGVSLASFDCELLEVKFIVELVSQLIEFDRMELNVPLHFLFSVLNLDLVFLIKHLEKHWVDIEIIFLDLNVLLFADILFIKFGELVLKHDDLLSDTFLLLVS